MTDLNCDMDERHADRDAADQKHADEIRQARDNGGAAWDVDAVGGDGCTLLMNAARGGFTASVKLLLEFNADINNRFLGKTALCTAVLYQRVDTVRVLLEHKASPNPPVQWDTPLQMAAKLDSKDLVTMLLEHKADLEAAGPTGKTAVLKAAWVGKAQMVALLVEHKANVHRRLLREDGSAGKTFVEYLEEEGGNDDDKSTHRQAILAWFAKPAPPAPPAPRAEVSAKTVDAS